MGNLVVDIGSPELNTHAYSTLEVFRIEALGTLDEAEFVEFGLKGQKVFFFQYTYFFHFRYSTSPFLTGPRVTLLTLLD